MSEQLKLFGERKPLILEPWVANQLNYGE